MAALCFNKMNNFKKSEILFERALVKVDSLYDDLAQFGEAELGGSIMNKSIELLGVAKQELKLQLFGLKLTVPPVTFDQYAVYEYAKKVQHNWALYSTPSSHLGSSTVQSFVRSYSIQSSGFAQTVESLSNITGFDIQQKDLRVNNDDIEEEGSVTKEVHDSTNILADSTEKSEETSNKGPETADSTQASTPGAIPNGSNSRRGSQDTNPDSKDVNSNEGSLKGSATGSRPTSAIGSSQVSIQQSLSRISGRSTPQSPKVTEITKSASKLSSTSAKVSEKSLNSGTSTPNQEVKSKELGPPHSSSHSINDTTSQKSNEIDHSDSPASQESSDNFDENNTIRSIHIRNTSNARARSGSGRSRTMTAIPREPLIEERSEADTNDSRETSQVGKESETGLQDENTDMQKALKPTSHPAQELTNSDGENASKIKAHKGRKASMYKPERKLLEMSFIGVGLDKNRKKPKVYQVALEELGALEQKKYGLAQTIEFTRILDSDAARLAAINNGLRYHVGTIRSLYFSPQAKPTSDSELITLRLIETGAFLVLTRPNQFKEDIVTENLVEIAMQLTKDLSFIQPKFIPKAPNFERFILKDVVTFYSFLYELHHWKLFDLLSGFLEKDAISSSPPNTLLLASIHLRKAMIKFHSKFSKKLTFHKGFSQETIEVKPVLELPKPTMIKFSRQDFDDIIDVLKFFFENETKKPHEEYKSLLTSCIEILWDFCETWMLNFRSGHHASDDTTTKNSAFAILHLLRNIFDYIPHISLNNPFIEPKMGTALGMMLENNKEIQAALQVYQRTLFYIQRCRDSFQLINESYLSLSCDIKQMVEHRLLSSAPGENSGIRISGSFAAIEIDMCAAITRCQYYLEEVEEKRRLQASLDKSRKKNRGQIEHNREVVIQRVIENYSNEYVKNRIYKAIRIMACVSIAGERLNLKKTKRYLEEAKWNLSYAQGEEESLMTYVVTRPGSKGKNMLFTPPTPTSSTRCPAPRIIKRSSSWILLKPSPWKDESGRLVVPRWYQVFAKHYSNAPITISDKNFDGCGFLKRNEGSVEFMVNGLLPNEKYRFALAAYDEHGCLLGGGIGDQTIGVVAMNPLPQALAWGYLTHVAQARGITAIEKFAFDSLWNIYVKWQCDINSLLYSSHQEWDPKVFEISETFMQHSSPAEIRIFVQTIILEYGDIHKESSSMASGHFHAAFFKTHQLKALHGCLCMGVALKLATFIEDKELVLLIIERIVKKISFILAFQSPSSIISKLLFKCHSSLLRFDNEDINKKTLNVCNQFVPVAFLLSKVLLEQGELQSLSEVIEKSLQFIKSNFKYPNCKIMGNAVIENHWFGITSNAPKKIRYGKAKYTQHLEHNYHIVLALKRKDVEVELIPVEVLLEYLETTRVLNCLPPEIGSANERVHLEHITTIKDIYLLAKRLGFDSAFQDLTKFRKNPRYMEIITKILEKSYQSVELQWITSKCQEILDWVDRRNYAILYPNLLIDDNASKDFRKHKRRNLFMDWKKGMKRYQGGAKYKMKSRSRSKSRDKKGSGGATTPKSTKSSAGSTKKSDDERKSNRSASAKGDETKEGEPSNEENKVEEPSKEKETPRDQSKRKDGNTKNNIPVKPSVDDQSGHGHVLIQSETLRQERCARILQKIFFTLWQFYRYRKRLRKVLEFESKWLTKLLFIFGKMQMEQLMKDLRYMDNSGWQSTEQPPQLDVVGVHSSGDYPVLTDNGKPMIMSVELKTSSIVEILQSYNRGIVTAGRYGYWFLVVSGCQQLWNTCKQLMRKQLLDKSLTRTLLWRPLLVTSDYLCDALEKSTIKVVDTEQTQASGDNQRSSTDIDGCSRGTHLFLSWTNSDNVDRFMVIELDWLTNYIKFTLECLLAGRAYYRLKELAKRFSAVTNGLYDYQLRQVREKCYNKLKRREQQQQEIVGDKSQTNLSLAEELEKPMSAPKQSDMPLHSLAKSRKEFLSYVRTSIGSSPTSHDCLNKKEKTRQAYKTCLIYLEEAHLDMTLVEAYNEYGNFLYDCGETQSACIHWSKVVDIVLQQEQVLYVWKETLTNYHEQNVLMERIRGYKYGMFAVLCLIKMAKYGYMHDYDKSSELCAFASQFLVLLITNTFPPPQHLMTLETAHIKHLFPCVDIFQNFYQIHVGVFIDTIVFLIKHLNRTQRFHHSIPICSLLEFVSSRLCGNVHYMLISKYLRLEALTEIGLMKEAFFEFKSLMDGSAIPELEKRNVTSRSGDLTDLHFNNFQSIGAQSNSDVLDTLSRFHFVESALYPFEKNILRLLDIRRLSFLLKLASFTLPEQVTIAPQDPEKLKSIHQKDSLNEIKFPFVTRTNSADYKMARTLLTYVEGGITNIISDVVIEHNRTHLGKPLNAARSYAVCYTYYLLAQTLEMKENREGAIKVVFSLLNFISKYVNTSFYSTDDWEKPGHADYLKELADFSWFEYYIYGLRMMLQQGYHEEVLDSIGLIVPKTKELRAHVYTLMLQQLQLHVYLKLGKWKKAENLTGEIFELKKQLVCPLQEALNSSIMDSIMDALKFIPSLMKDQPLYLQSCEQAITELKAHISLTITTRTAYSKLLTLLSRMQYKFSILTVNKSNVTDCLDAFRSSSLTLCHTISSPYDMLYVATINMGESALLLYQGQPDESMVDAAKHCFYSALRSLLKIDHCDFSTVSRCLTGLLLSFLETTIGENWNGIRYLAYISSIVGNLHRLFQDQYSTIKRVEGASLQDFGLGTQELIVWYEKEINKSIDLQRLVPEDLSQVKPALFMNNRMGKSAVKDDHITIPVIRGYYGHLLDQLHSASDWIESDLCSTTLKVIRARQMYRHLYKPAEEEMKTLEEFNLEECPITYQKELYSFHWLPRLPYWICREQDNPDFYRHNRAIIYFVKDKSKSLKTSGNTSHPATAAKASRETYNIVSVDEFEYSYIVRTLKELADNYTFKPEGDADISKSYVEILAKIRALFQKCPLVYDRQTPRTATIRTAGTASGETPKHKVHRLDHIEPIVY
jgi:hypothetical protein